MFYHQKDTYQEKKNLIEDLTDFCNYNHSMGHRCKFCLVF